MYVAKDLVVVGFAGLLACSFALLFFSIVLAMVAQNQIQYFMFNRGKQYHVKLLKSFDKSKAFAGK